jgi:hypothetical protein
MLAYTSVSCCADDSRPLSTSACARCTRVCGGGGGERGVCACSTSAQRLVRGQQVCLRAATRATRRYAGMHASPACACADTVRRRHRTHTPTHLHLPVHLVRGVWRRHARERGGLDDYVWVVGARDLGGPVLQGAPGQRARACARCCVQHRQGPLLLQRHMPCVPNTQTATPPHRHTATPPHRHTATQPHTHTHTHSHTHSHTPVHGVDVAVGLVLVLILHRGVLQGRALVVHV